MESTRPTEFLKTLNLLVCPQFPAAWSVPLPRRRLLLLRLLLRLLQLLRGLLTVAGERPAAEAPVTASTMVLRRGHDSSRH